MSNYSRNYTLRANYPRLAGSCQFLNALGDLGTRLSTCYFGKDSAEKVSLHYHLGSSCCCISTVLLGKVFLSS